MKSPESNAAARDHDGVALRRGHGGDRPRSCAGNVTLPTTSVSVANVRLPLPQHGVRRTLEARGPRQNALHGLPDLVQPNIR